MTQDELHEVFKLTDELNKAMARVRLLQNRSHCLHSLVAQSLLKARQRQDTHAVDALGEVTQFLSDVEAGLYDGMKGVTT